MTVRSILIIAVATTFASCSGGAKKSESASASEQQAQARSISKEDILQKYSLQELNSAANALKVVSDKSTDVMGCGMTGPKALSMTMPLKALIDEQVRSETVGYEQAPKAYAASAGFESCAAKCSCGAFSDIVSGAQEGSLPKTSLVQHKRHMARLRAKAQLQSEEDSLTCAKKQSWFCSSELRSYLERDLAENK